MLIGHFKVLSILSSGHESMIIHSPSSLRLHVFKASSPLSFPFLLFLSIIYFRNGLGPFNSTIFFTIYINRQLFEFIRWTCIGVKNVKLLRQIQKSTLPIRSQKIFLAS